MDIHEEINKYCKANITDYDDRVSLALGLMERYRVPLEMVASDLYFDILTAIEEWCEDHGKNAEDVDPEEVIFS